MNNPLTTRLQRDLMMPAHRINSKPLNTCWAPRRGEIAHYLTSRCPRHLPLYRLPKTPWHWPWRWQGDGGRQQNDHHHRLLLLLFGGKFFARATTSEQCRCERLYISHAELLRDVQINLRK